MRVVITGAGGLLGWHSAAHMHAANCAAQYLGNSAPFDLVMVDHETFANPSAFAAALDGADAVLHFAGVNRGEDSEVERANPAIARGLVQACAIARVTPHVVYANTLHAHQDNHYGRSKRIAGELLAENFPCYTSLVLPHIFGECARPNYNNVTATLIAQLWNDEAPTINDEGSVNLLYAGKVAKIAIDAMLMCRQGEIALEGRTMSIAELYGRLRAYHEDYVQDIFPNFTDEFELALFNSYRTGGYPERYPKHLESKIDHRGMLFETSKALGSSQSFISITHPGKSRGDHFHTDLVERFLVVSGRAIIRIRKVLTDEVHEFIVDGDNPVAIDMPPLHTHHLVNIGDEPVITFFWSHRLFDPSKPDTFADVVQHELVAR